MCKLILDINIIEQVSKFKNITSYASLKETVYEKQLKLCRIGGFYGIGCKELQDFTGNNMENKYLRVDAKT